MYAMLQWRYVQDYIGLCVCNARTKHSLFDVSIKRLSVHACTVFRLHKIQKTHITVDKLKNLDNEIKEKRFKKEN